MTNERAIELLNRISDSQFDGPHGDERREALEMAVRALFSQQTVNDSQGLVNDCISRNMAIDALTELREKTVASESFRIGIYRAIEELKNVPSAQTETHDKRTETHTCDLINRQQAIAIVRNRCKRLTTACVLAVTEIEQLPSAQPERTCVNCGRTVNNGGWYADGGTRCPIEEHYALPKDGYCHLWEKRNVTDDDYPERRTDEQTKD